MTEKPDQTTSRNKARKGRGALTNRSGRFETHNIEFIDDGWGLDPRVDRPKTQLSPDTTRSIIAYNQSPDINFDRSINPYRGCEHGCIYCFARPTHTYLGFSAGLDFETRLVVKYDAAELLEKELSSRSYSCDTIAISPNTDCYQPIEKELQITRSILEVCQHYKQPVSMITKSSMVVRDIDILSDMASNGLANVVISVTTLDRKLSAKLEPRAAAPHRRLQTIKALNDAGIPTGVLMAPMIPFINDEEMETLLGTCAEAGITSAGYVLLRLPLEVRELWLEWLQEHYPDRAARVMKIIHASRGGKAYDAGFGTRMTGTGDYAGLLNQRFKKCMKKFNLTSRSTKLNTSLFTAPDPAGQMSFELE